jgi:hypothetical protein
VFWIISLKALAVPLASGLWKNKGQKVVQRVASFSNPLLLLSRPLARSKAQETRPCSLLKSCQAQLATLV